MYYHAHSDGIILSLIITLYLEGTLKVIHSSGFSDFFYLHTITAFTSGAFSLETETALVTCVIPKTSGVVVNGSESPREAREQIWHLRRV